MLLSANLFINKAADYLLFVRNTIIIKHSGEINMLSRHAFGNAMLLSCSSCNVTMGRSFIRFVNRSVINQTQDPAARMVVVTYTIKKSLHHAKPRERSGERREHWGPNNNCLEAGALPRITNCLSFCAKGKETCKHSLRAFTPTTHIHAIQLRTVRRKL